MLQEYNLDIRQIKGKKTISSLMRLQEFNFGYNCTTCLDLYHAVNTILLSVHIVVFFFLFCFFLLFFFCLFVFFCCCCCFFFFMWQTKASFHKFFHVANEIFISYFFLFPEKGKCYDILFHCCKYILFL